MAIFDEPPDAVRRSLSGSSDVDRPRFERKQSTPLLPSFMVSAPGKVIVYGEHAVVHGKAAIAAAISLRSYLLVTFHSKTRRTVSLQFPDIDLDHTWSIDELPWGVFSAPDKKRYYHSAVTSIDPELLEALKPHLDNISPQNSDQVRKIHQNSALAFLYLFLSLGSRKSYACTYTLRSTIPIGAGLGSSASIAVCLSAALLKQSDALAGPIVGQPGEEAEQQVERINHWAFVAELCIHSNPSGVDNTVSAHGKAVLFLRTDYGKPPTVKKLHNFPELPLLLVNTRQSRSTLAQLEKVANLMRSHPQITGYILEGIDGITRSGYKLITREDFNPDDPDTRKHIGELLSMNHGLLVSLGVSHPKLDRVREIIDHTGIGWTKLTGAGGGGCAITILKHEYIEEETAQMEINGHVSRVNGSTLTGEPAPRERSGSTQLQSLSATLQRENFQIFSTTLAGDGVGILFPAVLQYDSGEEGGEAVDQENFMNAVGNEGIEALVGVDSSFGKQTVREGWKFWRPWEG